MPGFVLTFLLTLCSFALVNSVLLLCDCEDRVAGAGGVLIWNFSNPVSLDFRNIPG